MTQFFYWFLFGLAVLGAFELSVRWLDRRNRKRKERFRG